jgi:hypothetical protein
MPNARIVAIDPPGVELPAEPVLPDCLAIELPPTPGAPSAWLLLGFPPYSLR